MNPNLIKHTVAVTAIATVTVLFILLMIAIPINLNADYQRDQQIRSDFIARGFSEQEADAIVWMKHHQ